MATKTLTTGAVQFNGSNIEMGKPYLVNGRKAVPFMAWVRDGVTPDGLKMKANTEIRFKFEKGTGYKLEDFNTVFGKKAVIQEMGA